MLREGLGRFLQVAFDLQTQLLVVRLQELLLVDLENSDNDFVHDNKSLNEKDVPYTQSKLYGHTRGE